MFASAILPLPPEVAPQLVEVVPYDPNYSEGGKRENSTLNDYCLGVEHLTCSPLCRHVPGYCLALRGLPDH